MRTTVGTELAGQLPHLCSCREGWVYVVVGEAVALHSDVMCAAWQLQQHSNIQANAAGKAQQMDEATLKCANAVPAKRSS
jgi:hypothetical protein